MMAWAFWMLTITESYSAPWLLWTVGGVGQIQQFQLGAVVLHGAARPEIHGHQGALVRIRE